LEGTAWIGGVILQRLKQSGESETDDATCSPIKWSLSDLLNELLKGTVSIQYLLRVPFLYQFFRVLQRLLLRVIAPFLNVFEPLSPTRWRAGGLDDPSANSIPLNQLSPLLRG
jgi:hypothetical protein